MIALRGTKVVTNMAFVSPIVVRRWSNGAGICTKSVSKAPEKRVVVMGLRNEGRMYNEVFDRSRIGDNGRGGVESSEGLQTNEGKEEKLAEEVAAGDGTGGNGWGSYGGRDDGDGGEEREEKENEVGVLLRETGRGLESLPKEVRMGTAQQIGRYLTLEKGLFGWIVRAWPGLRDRLVANKRLPVQMGVELSVGFVTKTLAEVQGRGERFWKEFDFYLSDMALELVGDAMLVWLLSPMVIWGGVVKSGGLAGIVGRLPKHAGQIGKFGLMERVGGFCYKGMQFGAVGFLSSVLGHGVTKEMVKRRKEKRGEKEEEGVELAEVLPNSIVWGLFMMSSSNFRYQVVNMVEQRVVDPVFGRNGVALTAVTSGLRFGNCLLGGIHWLPFARWFGIQ